MVRADDSATELVELGEPESLSTFYDDDGRILDVHTNLDDGRRDEDVRRACGEALHRVVLRRRCHLAVEDVDLVLGEYVPLEPLRLLFHGLRDEGELFLWVRFIYSRTDDVRLPAGAEFGAYLFIHRRALLGSDDFGHDGLPSEWHLVEEREVEVAVDGEGERARDGRRGHGEEVGDDAILSDEGAALARAEAVLFVDDGVREVFELHGLLDERVRADEDGNLAVPDPLQELCARDVGRLAPAHLRGELFAPRTGDEPDGELVRGEIFYERLEVLFREDFRRCHVGDLEVAVCLSLGYIIASRQ